jgi:hypothetical protein
MENHSAAGPAATEYRNPSARAYSSNTVNLRKKEISKPEIIVPILALWAFGVHWIISEDQHDMRDEMFLSGTT